MVSGKYDDPRWKETVLWQQISRKDGEQSEQVRATLEQRMPEIDAIIAFGGTSPLDFTLHDSGHSFRVAQRMAELIQPDLLPQLSIYELALLLLSAYLHDIGMTPERKKVSAHHDYLLTGEPKGLSPEEVETFQKWLDDEGEGVVPLISKTSPGSDILRAADELTIRYCRFRHNDWSESWIRENLRGNKLGGYDAWLEDLVILCRSHHQDYVALVSAAFDPRIVGHSGEVVHLRYLAVLLRVADVLEFDPERTPEVILRHRGISPQSLVFWWKDHQITSVIKDNRIVVSGRPSTARIHRAIELTIDQVNHELGICRRLADNTHFEKFPGLPNDLPHHWGLVSSVHANIQPLNDGYEYIDGSFRPDTRKLLQLFSGTELYGDPLVAVRELLQNAFDAVREQIAYERLAQPSPSDAALERTLGNLHRVVMRVEPSEDGMLLVCSDDGVGMTKSIIRDRLLVSGASKRHDVLKLERECKSQGFSLGRTGEFGIGVLSYFMLADRVTIVTRRSQEAGEVESFGWRFETEGVGAFGELRRTSEISRGTEVLLHLKPGVVGEDQAKWYETLRKYIEDLLVRIPCQFTLNAVMPGTRGLSFGCGWVLSEARRAELVVNCVPNWDYQEDEKTPIGLLSTSRRRQIEARALHRNEVLSEFKSSLRFEVHEVELDNAQGRARVHIPYFELPGGVSLKFLRVRSVESKLILDRIRTGYTLAFTMPVRAAWKGMKTASTYGQTRYPGIHHSISSEAGLIELDWIDPGSGNISVSRNRFTLTEVGAKISRSELIRARGLRARIAASNEHSAYAWLNRRTIGEDTVGKTRMNWICSDDENETRQTWGPIKFPAVSALVFTYSSDAQRRLKWKGKPVRIIRCLGGPTDDDAYDGESWNPITLDPDRVMRVIAREFTYRLRVAPLWTKPPKNQAVSHVVGTVSKFPPSWHHICGVHFAHFSGMRQETVVWNPDHVLLRLVEPGGWEWCKRMFESILDPIPHRAELLSNPSRAASWLLMCLQREQHQLWDGLRDRDQDFLTELWKVVHPPTLKVGAKKLPAIFQWVEDSSSSRLRELLPERWVARDLGIGSENRIEDYFPELGPEWVLQIERAEEDRRETGSKSKQRPRRPS